MSWREVLRSVKLLFVTCFITFFNPEKYEVGEELPEGALNKNVGDLEWDQYWNKRRAGGLLYDAVAAMYRKLVIRPALNHFVKSYFAAGAKVLHAGCGSGQVDRDIRDYVSITGFDVSQEGLQLYHRINGSRCSVLHGSVFEIPLPPNSLDGIYSLGLMEHFSDEQIQQILAEFKRVLKPGGRIITFWPPEFGASVLFFKCLKWFFSAVLKKPDVKFHPDEICRIKSRIHALHIFQRAGLPVMRYYFGPRDLFIQCVIVAGKDRGSTKVVPIRQQVESELKAAV